MVALDPELVPSAVAALSDWTRRGAVCQETRQQRSAWGSKGGARAG